MKAKRRALYLYICEKCGHKRSSRIYTRATENICAKCRRESVPENQPSLFAVLPELTEEDKKLVSVINEQANIMAESEAKRLEKKIIAKKLYSNKTVRSKKCAP